MRPRDWVIALAALAAVGVAIFAVGSVHRGPQAIVAVLVAVAVATTALSGRRRARPSPLVVLLGVASGLTVLQLLPLSDGLLEQLAPVTHALRVDGAELLGISPWSAISADAGATLGALVMFLTLLGLASITLRISASERGRYRIVASVAALCTLTAVVSLIHKLFALTSLYGLYEPEYAKPQILGPLLNGNSLACLTAFGAMLCIGLAAHRRQPGWLRALWLLAILPCGAVTVITVSRGATIAFIGGSLVVLGLLMAQRFTTQEKGRKRRSSRFLSNALPMATLAGCLVVLVIYSNASSVERQLSELSIDEIHYSRSKFAAWRAATALIEESPWVGVGRGAFASTFPRVHDASGLATYSYVENEYVQAVVDWGIPGAGLLGLALLWLAYASARRWKDGALAAGSLGALVVVAMQSNVDFGLEFLGLAAPVTAIAATLAYVPLREATRPLIIRGLRVTHALGLLAGAGLLLSDVTTSLDEDRAAISQRTNLVRVRESANRHPLDYYSYAVAADLLKKSGDTRAIRLLNHALALHPSHPHLHRMAARMLKEQGFVAQSAVEYAAALKTTPDPRELLTEIAGAFSPEQAANALPITDVDPAALTNALDALGKLEVARNWLGRLLVLQQNVSQACSQMYRLAERGDVKAAEMAGRSCSDRLPDYQTRIVLARMLSTKTAYSETVRLLHDVDAWQSRREEKVDAWFLLCDAHLALGNADEGKRCLRRLDASPDMLEEQRATLFQRIEDANRSPRPQSNGDAPQTPVPPASPR